MIQGSRDRLTENKKITKPSLKPLLQPTQHKLPRSGLLEQCGEREPPIASVLKSEFFGGGPVTATVMSSIRTGERRGLSLSLS